MGRTKQECIEQLEELEMWMDEMFSQVERRVEWSMSDYMNLEDAKTLCSPFYYRIESSWIEDWQLEKRS